MALYEKLGSTKNPIAEQTAFVLNRSRFIVAVPLQELRWSDRKPSYFISIVPPQSRLSCLSHPDSSNLPSCAQHKLKKS